AGSCPIRMKTRGSEADPRSDIDPPARHTSRFIFQCGSQSPSTDPRGEEPQRGGPEAKSFQGGRGGPFFLREGDVTWPITEPWKRPARGNTRRARAAPRTGRREPRNRSGSASRRTP